MRKLTASLAAIVVGLAIGSAPALTQAQTAKPVGCHFIPGVTPPSSDDQVVQFKLAKKGATPTANVFVWPLDASKVRFQPTAHEHAGTCPGAPQKEVVNWIAKINTDGVMQIAFAAGVKDLKFRVNYEGTVYQGDLKDQKIVTLTK